MPNEPAEPLEPGTKWEGDLSDDCVMRIGGCMAHCEALSTVKTIDEETGEEWYSDSWYVGVYGPNNEVIFHSGEPAGSIDGGEMARAVGETILRLQSKLSALEEHIDTLSQRCGFPIVKNRPQVLDTIGKKVERLEKQAAELREPCVWKHSGAFPGMTDTSCGVTTAIHIHTAGAEDHPVKFCCFCQHPISEHREET